MKCPYCVSDLPATALACAHCGRDIFLFKPLLQQMEALECRLTEVAQRLEALEARSGATTPQEALAVRADADASPQDSAGVADRAVASHPSAWRPWAGALISLLVAHALITVTFDLPTLWLRVASLFIPLPFGFAVTRSSTSLAAQLMWGASLAAAAVMGMSGVVALVDGTPVLPATGDGWREFLQYATSIGLSFATGIVLGRHVRRAYAHAQTGSLTWLQLLRSGTDGAEKLQAKAEALRGLVTALVAIGTTVASVVTGLQGLAGG